MRPIFKSCLIGVSAVVMLQLAAFRVLPALTDGLTACLGFMLLRRDIEGLVQGLVPFAAVAALNCFFQALTLAELLDSPPGAAYFFKCECVFPPGTLVLNGHKVNEPVNLCSWQTVLGNIALCAALPLEFLCARYAWKLRQSMGEAVGGLASAMMDLETAQLASVRTAAFRQPPPAPAATTGAGLASTGAAAQVGGPRAGFTPYSGQAHRLGD